MADIPELLAGMKPLLAETMTNPGQKMQMKNIVENYQRIAEYRRTFDIRYWQDQGDEAIFEAVFEMMRDYFMIRGKDACEFRIQRTVESFRKI